MIEASRNWEVEYPVQYPNRTADMAFAWPTGRGSSYFVHFHSDTGVAYGQGVPQHVLRRAERMRARAH